MKCPYYTECPKNVSEYELKTRCEGKYHTLCFKYIEIKLKGIEKIVK